MEPNRLAPTAAPERIQTIDILRGFALLGILLVNMEFFSHSYFDYILGAQGESALDRWARLFVQFFAEGKFYSMFAFLFGLGMAIFMHRCEAKGIPFVPLYTRRLLVLLAFGIIHAYLLWYGDILILYSVIGFLTLWLLRNRTPRRLVRLAVIFLLVPVVINFLLWGATALGTAMGGAEASAGIDAGMEQGMRVYRDLDARADAIYSSGSYWETVGERARTMNWVFATLPFSMFNVWAMFVLGFAAGKARLHERLDQERALLKRVLLWGGVIGVIGNLIYVIGSQNSNRIDVTELSLLATTGQTFGAPALSLFYMAGITLLALEPQRRRLFAPLAAAGRMAITNYLAQTLIMTTLMYGYGFGWYGLGAAAGVALAFAVWGVQLVWSVLWLRSFRFGPVEWLWRTLTYGRAQPMRLVVAPDAG